MSSPYKFFEYCAIKYFSESCDSLDFRRDGFREACRNLVADWSLEEETIKRYFNKALQSILPDAWAIDSSHVYILEVEDTNPISLEKAGNLWELSFCFDALNSIPHTLSLIIVDRYGRNPVYINPYTEWVEINNFS